MKKDIEIKLTEELDRKMVGVPQFIYDYILTLEEDYSVSTRIEYVKDIKKFLDFLMEQEQFENMKESILDFTPQELSEPLVKERDIYNYLSYVRNYKKSYAKKDGSIVVQRFKNTEPGRARKLATLHRLYKYLLRQHFIAIDPTAIVQVKLPKKIGITNVLDDAELKSYIDVIMNDDKVKSPKEMQFHRILKFRDYIMNLLFCYTGMRVGELVQLDIPDINLDKGTVTLNRKRKKIQVLDLPIKIIEPLALYIEERKRMQGLDPLYKNALFISLHKKRIDQRTVRYTTKKYQIRAQINTPITPHTIRRTFGTALLDKTGNLALAADVLGHENSETTRKHYTILNKKREREVMQDFEFSFDEAAATKENNINLSVAQLKKISERTGLTIEELIKTLD
jgi:site-specific recombinase XerD